MQEENKIFVVLKTQCAVTLIYFSIDILI